MYDPPGPHGYNGGLTVGEARRIDAEKQKMKMIEEILKKGQLKKIQVQYIFLQRKKGQLVRRF